MTDRSRETPTLRMRRLGTAQIELFAIMEGERLSTLFQPIIDARTRRMHGCEALSRGPSDSWLHSPLNLFEAARHAGVGIELDFRCIELALRRAVKAGAAGRLFINVSPDSISQAPDFADRLACIADREGFPVDRCVLELTEDSLVDDYRELAQRLTRVRARGCQIAIDDLGAGRSGLKTWSELKPDYVKIDRYFISNVDSDPTKFEFVRSIIEMGHATGCQVLAEGVETESESRDLVALGIDYMQGYLFGRPDASLPEQIEFAEAAEPWTASQLGMTADQLVEHVPPLDPETRVADVVERFRTNPGLETVAVVAADRPVGVVRRQALFALLSKPLYPELYNRKPVTAIMEPPTLMIDVRLRLEQVSRLVTRKMDARVADQFVVTRDGRYAGMGATMNLLRQITEQQLNAARQSNPLTLLPGNAVIQRRIGRAVERKRRFVVCYVDLDGFKSYNDRYGYLQGDQVILQLATLLRSTLSQRLDFVGHVGGDDFVLLMRSRDWRARVDLVLERFPAVVARLEQTQCQRSEPSNEGAARDPCGTPTLSISIAALDSEAVGCISVDEIAARLAQLKKRAKARVGNSFILQSGERVVDLRPRDESDAAANTVTITPADVA